GVTPSNLAVGATSYSADVVVAGASKAGTVCGWVDFNQNSIFDNPTERACSSVAASATPATYTLTWSGLPTLTPGTTFARFRTGYNLAQNQSPIGAADAGEVEDYPIVIDAERAEIALDKWVSAFTDANQSGEYDAG